jgi:excisionase family DNA binding protein
MAEKAYWVGEKAVTTQWLWNVNEVAEFLGLSVGTIYHLASQGRIPCVRLSARCLKFQPEEIMQWVKQKSEQGDVK